jgi:hypothetical protein
MDISIRSNVSSVDRVIQLMKDVIQEEGNRHILQNQLRHVYHLLLDISSPGCPLPRSTENDVVFQDQQKASPKALKIWLQLMCNSLTHANKILHCYGPSQRQRHLNCLMCNPGRLSKRIKEWKVLFNYLFQGLQEDFSMFVTALIQFIINRDPIQLMSLHRRTLLQEEFSMFVTAPIQLMSVHRRTRLSKDEAQMLLR